MLENSPQPPGISDSATSKCLCCPASASCSSAEISFGSPGGMYEPSFARSGSHSPRRPARTSFCLTTFCAVTAREFLAYLDMCIPLCKCPLDTVAIFFCTRTFMVACRKRANVHHIFHTLEQLVRNLNYRPFLNEHFLTFVSSSAHR